jgi:hypothetical protein
VVMVVEENSSRASPKTEQEKVGGRRGGSLGLRGRGNGLSPLYIMGDRLGLPPCPHSHLGPAQGEEEFSPP